MLRYLEIKQELMKLIDKLHPGEQLADRYSLCRALDTTRVTLDKAIRELVEQNILVSKKGSGTFVSGAISGRKNGTMNWCVIVPNISEAVYGKLVSGVESIAHNHNINVILCNSNNDPEKQENFVKRLLISGISGFIIVPVINNLPLNTYNLYNVLENAHIPFVLCNRRIDGINAPVITSNDFYGGYIATNHLISKGYKNIAYIAETHYRTSLDRCQGYLSALLENHIDVNRRLIVIPSANQLEIDCRQEISALLQTEPIDAIFCFNDKIASLVYDVIQSMGKKVGVDIGVIGYDNTEICTDLSPALTSLSYSSNEIGIKAAEVLFNLCNGKEPSSKFEYYLYQPEIIERNSCSK